MQVLRKEVWKLPLACSRTLQLLGEGSHSPPTAGPRPAQRATLGEDHTGSQFPLLCQALGARLGPPTSF